MQSNLFSFDERLFRIDVKNNDINACFGIISYEGIIIHAAPIARWMVGKRLEAIKPWLRRNNAKVVEIKTTYFCDMS
jgi:hypothetical protein